MCDTQNKTKPIPINYKKSTCQNPTLNHHIPCSSYEYKKYDYVWPKYSNTPPIKNSITSHFRYSNNGGAPDDPKDKTPPNKKLFQKIYMDMFANIYLKNSLD